MAGLKEALMDGLRSYVGFGTLEDWRAMSLVRVVELDVILGESNRWNRFRLSRAVSSSSWPQSTSSTPLLSRSYVHALLALSHYTQSSQTANQHWELARSATSDKKEDSVLPWLDMVLELSVEEAYRMLSRANALQGEEKNEKNWRATDSNPLSVIAEEKSSQLLNGVWSQIFVELMRQQAQPDSPASVSSLFMPSKSSAIGGAVDPLERLRGWTRKTEIDDALARLTLLVNPGSRNYLLSMLTTVLWNVWQGRGKLSDVESNKLVRILEGEEDVAVRLFLLYSTADADKHISSFSSLIETHKASFRYISPSTALIFSTLSYLFLHPLLHSTSPVNGGKEGMMLNRSTLGVRLLFNNKVWEDEELGERGERDLVEAVEEWADRIQLLGRKAVGLLGTEEDSGIDVD
ncbi:hypothetical protein BT69DRAFT_1286460 [Atractiella rhizophila]|nr:hypothetical protein BT69DRAFT_1286460 [Atractiella rhizophila]